VVLKRILALALLLLVSTAAFAQEPSGTEPTVPSFVQYAGVLADGNGRPIKGAVEVTFSLYKAPEGGTALWMESQRVHADSLGKYAVMLGSTTIQGLPSSFFVAGEARWLGVQVEGQPEATRVMLLSVPYALKAGDSETLGGLPASAFMLAGTAGGISQNAAPPNLESTTAVSAALGGTGTTDFLPLWTNSTTLGNSVLFQAGTGSTAKVGINTTTPAATLDVKGAATVRGNLSFPATGVATATAGKNSEPLTFTASVFNSSSSASLNENFRWQAEPVGNDTASASGSLNLLSAQGTGAYAETGLKLGRNGLITFAPGQKFPATGTITGVTAGSGLTGGGTTGNVTLALDATKVPQLNSNNTFTGAQQFANTGIGMVPSKTTYTPLSVGTANSFGTWLAISNTSPGGHTWNIISAGTGNAEGAGNLGITDLTGKSTLWLEGNTNVSGALNVNSSNNPLASSAITAQGYDGSDGIIATGGSGDSSSQVADGSGGVFTGASNYCCGNGIEAYTGSDLAGYFSGNVSVEGSINKLSGSFKIDHPLDPANKYLYHSFVESPDMMDIYNGNVVTDATGNAIIPLPEWFETLNRDFRYQLTVIGQFAQAIVVQKVSHHQFGIKTDKPGVEVSWQLTGIRQDPWANAHRIPVEEEKDARDRGHYIRPELYGAPEEASVAWARHPTTMRKLKQLRDAGRRSATQSALDARRALPSK